MTINETKRLKAAANHMDAALNAFMRLEASLEHKGLKASTELTDIFDYMEANLKTVNKFVARSEKANEQ